MHIYTNIYICVCIYIYICAPWRKPQDFFFLLTSKPLPFAYLASLSPPTARNHTDPAADGLAEHAEPYAAEHSPSVLTQHCEVIGEYPSSPCRLPSDPVSSPQHHGVP